MHSRGRDNKKLERTKEVNQKKKKSQLPGQILIDVL